ncbi:hypothetical protein A1O1_03082 [Capronia coronata CBS 617.96]|uniref:C3H1-type domain-containing protein n=1 Tax=Capronia coronata CBS 617.96 TaxID=1182541 RepID=W9YYA9_9EURO|nr:uncharacterized protein A1O1_03082 [Capronia coronata CBS 617.96]EXJ94685.1 hypothetical protein A1O1_03082 [Capronia coronata CBS 617.96]
MVVCKYFLNGNCKFGSNCRNEHPGAGFANQNRFGALSGGGSSRFGGGSGSNEARQDRWRISSEDVRNDLTDGKGRPKWILTAYGPGRSPPASLLESNELSSEEVRVRFYELASQGKAAEADQEAGTLWNKAVHDMGQILNKVEDVNKFMEDADKKHPNRNDFVNMDGTKTRDQFVQQFANNTPATAFGQSSTPNPFAKPAASTFGQPAQPSIFGGANGAKPAFGQAGFGSGGGQSATSSPFGQASAGSPFGQPSSTSTFGKPAFGSSGGGQPTFGQPAQPASTFGQPSQPTSAFGQPSQPAAAFGKPSQPTSAFGQPAFGSSGFGANAAKSPFAAASASASAGSGFGQGGATFGQPSQPSSTFGQPSQPTSSFGQPSQPASTFGQPAQPSSTFGQPSAFGNAGFGQSTPTPTLTSTPTSTFGQPSQPTPAFGQPSQPSGSPFGQAASTASPFGQPAFGSNTTTTTTTPAFGQPSAPANPFGGRPAEPQPNDQAMETTTPAPSRPASRGNPFGAPFTQSPQPQAQPQPAQPMATPSTQPAAAKPIVNTSITPHPLTGRPPHAVHYTQTLPLQPTQKNASGQVAAYRGQRVQYVDGVPCYARPDGKGLEKIWFPDAGATPEVVALNREDKIADTQGSAADYTDEIVDKFKNLFEQGRFADGKIPLIPPLREWGVYDF